MSKSARKGKNKPTQMPPALTISDAPRSRGGPRSRRGRAWFQAPARGRQRWHGVRVMRSHSIARDAKRPFGQPLGRRDNQHVAARMVRDVIRHRAQHAPGAGHAPVADHDHLRAFLLRDRHQGFPGLSWPHVSLGFDTEVPQPLLRSIDTLLGEYSLAAGFHRRGEVDAVATDHMNRRAEGACDHTSAVHRPLGPFGAVGSDDNWLASLQLTSVLRHRHRAQRRRLPGCRVGAIPATATTISSSSADSGRLARKTLYKVAKHSRQLSLPALRSSPDRRR